MMHALQGKSLCSAVVGGCGFLGRHLVEKLVERGYQVNVFDIRKSFEDDRVKFFVGDLCNKKVRDQSKLLVVCDSIIDLSERTLLQLWMV